LIYSNLDEGTATRRRITVWASFDGGKSWPVKRLVYEGPSAYSSLAAGREGTPSEGLIYLMFEGGPGGMYSALQVARFNLGWITGGKSRRQ
jgi:sialidase-1